MKVKKKFKRIIGEIAKKVLEILIYFDQKRIGKCKIILRNGKINIDIYVSQSALYRSKRGYYFIKNFIKPRMDNVEVNYILDGLNINKNVIIVNFDSKVIIKNCKINAPIDFSVHRIEFENNKYTNLNVKDYSVTSIVGNAHYLKFKNENIDNQKFVLSFKSKKFEIENSDLNIDDISLDTKYFIIQNSDIKVNQFDVLNNEVSYFNGSDIKSNCLKVNTKKFVNKKSKIKANKLDYNGKIMDSEVLLEIVTTNLDSQKNLRATLTSKLIKLKENLENSKKQIVEKVCKDLEERKVKKYLKK